MQPLDGLITLQCSQTDFYNVRHIDQTFLQHQQFCITVDKKYIDLTWYTLHRYSKQRERDSWAHQAGLTHLSLVCSPGLCGTVYALSIANSTLWNWPIVSLLILFYFILFSNVFFCILVHDYTLCFIGSPCCSISYYNYISVWPYYLVIHFCCCLHLIEHKNDSIISRRHENRSTVIVV